MRAYPDYADVVDLDRYPIHALGGPEGRALIGACRARPAGPRRLLPAGVCHPRSVPRINSVLTYGERPDMRLNDLTSRLFYGRTSR